MVNLNKYFVLLESLDFPVVGAPKDSIIKEEERIKSNLKILKKYYKLTTEQLIESIITERTSLKYLESRQTAIIGNQNDKFLYCLYSLKMLLEVSKNVNFSSNVREDLISEKHKSLIISSIIDVAKFGLQGNLHETFYKKKAAVFEKLYKNETNFCQVEFIVDVISSLIHIKQLHVGTALDDVQLWYMAAIFSLFIVNESKEYQMEVSNIENLQTKLQKLWLDLSKSLYYRNLMVLYSTICRTQRPIIHREMLLRLWSKGGFMALLFAMANSQRSEEQSLDEMIANLVSQPSYSLKAQQSLLKQILDYLRASLKNKELLTYMGAGILSLRKLYDNKPENVKYFVEWLEKEMQPLVRADEFSLIAMEWCDFTDLIFLLFHIFCTSSIATMPSDLLLPYLPVLIELYSQVECYMNQVILSNQLQSLILKILNNRSKVELSYIIECITLERYPEKWFQLNCKIHVKENPLNMQELKLSLFESETDNALLDTNHLRSLIAILKNSTYNLLTYQVFVILLQLMRSLITDKSVSTSSTANIHLLESQEDVYNKLLFEISRSYNHKFHIIKSLESLIQHQPLKTLIIENIQELLKVLQNILVTLITDGQIDSLKETNSEVLTILLILIREIIENCSVDVSHLQNTLFKPLKHLLSQAESENLKYQINLLIKLIQGEDSFHNCHSNSEKNQFEDARKLIESNESYLQVEGIEKMIKLINKRDAFTVTNSHILTALALNTLKSPESYTFLNCVRLFVALINVNESEVLVLLSDEYLNDTGNLDYRLVIGEAILKTCRELGPLCYKYKNVLLNTYMIGCRSLLDEFRFSAFSNLSQMCRLLTYQVHNYFQELLHLIDCEITTGKYLPAKRAAVMVLSDLLSGMDNLVDYGDMLLPIYRLLKYLVGSETDDEKIRIHASNGLKYLSEKCRELFKKSLEQGALEKEIKIRGIKDKPKQDLESLILEMN